jgi:hypothetical protein
MIYGTLFQNATLNVQCPTLVPFPSDVATLSMHLNYNPTVEPHTKLKDFVSKGKPLFIIVERW